MNYGTWNVQGIRGKMAEITSELGKLKVDVIGRQNKREHVEDRRKTGWKE
jgi:exonuclease III